LELHLQLLWALVVRAVAVRLVRAKQTEMILYFQPIHQLVAVMVALSQLLPTAAARVAVLEVEQAQAVEAEHQDRAMLAVLVLVLLIETLAVVAVLAQ
jgi:hypothetical protein